MDKSQIKKGTYVRWTADRMFKSWDTYGIITKVTDKEATIKTFDDLKETTICIEGEAMTEEVRCVSKIEVQKYIDKAIMKLKHRIDELELEHKGTISSLNEKIKFLEETTL